jgi:hypothetical protein
MTDRDQEAYRHAVDGCPEDAPCDLCADLDPFEELPPTVRAEAQRLEAQIADDEARWLRAFQLTNPIDAFSSEVQ